MGKYDVEWRKYRRLRLTSRVGYLAFVPFLFVLIFIHEMKVYTPFFAVEICVVFFVAVKLCLNFFRCPRCHRFFAAAWRYAPRTWASECLHCGLERFSSGDQPGTPSQPPSNG